RSRKIRLNLLVCTTRRSSLRISRLETWFGRQYCHWELKIKSLVNGLQLGTGRTRLIRFCLGMHTCSRNWTAPSFLLLSMANTSRSISRACGKASNKSRSDPSGNREKGQHVELASKNTYEKQDRRCVTIDLRCFKCVQVSGLTGNIKCFLNSSTSSEILLWHGWLLHVQHPLVL